MKASMVTQEYCDLVNELIPGTKPEQAYAVGAVSALAFRDGLQPDRELLRAALRAPTLSSIDVIYNEWKGTRES
jgi:hypothetical protein